MPTADSKMEFPDTALVLPSWVPDLSVEGIPYPLTRLDKFALESPWPFVPRATTWIRQAKAQKLSTSLRITETYFVCPVISLIRSDKIWACLFPVSRSGPIHGRNTKRRTTLGFFGRQLLVLDGTPCTKMKLRTTSIGRSWEEGNSEAIPGWSKTIQDRIRIPSRALPTDLAWPSCSVSHTLQGVMYSFLSRFGFADGMRRLRGKPIIKYTSGIGTNVSEDRRMGKSSNGTIC